MEPTGRGVARACWFARGDLKYSLAAGVLASTAAAATGPVAPELTSFAPFGQLDLVDHFTGDFRYAVPLFEVPGPNGGYPISLSYASGITPGQDASWVGLGWTLSPGAIVRQLRATPDEFQGNADGADDTITTTHDIEPNLTFGLSVGANFEFFGADSSIGTGVSTTLKAYFDNYRGFGLAKTIGLSGQAKASGISGGLGLSFTKDSLEGSKVGATASLALADGIRFSADSAFDPLRGLSALSVGTQYSYQGLKILTMSADLTSFLGHAKPASLPGTGRNMTGSNIDLSFKAGGEIFGGYIDGTMAGFYNQERLAETKSAKPAYGFLHLDRATGPDDVLDFNREHDGPIYDSSPNLAVPVLTNDLFVVSGRDIAGTFRAFRNDVAFVHDPEQNSTSTGGALGVDIGYGNLVKVGVNAVLNGSSTRIGKWDGGNADALSNRNVYRDGADTRERTYFKFIGELAAVPTVSPTPMAVPLLNVGWEPDQVPPTFHATEAIDLPMPSNARRMPRSRLVEAFTYKEMRERSAAIPELKREHALVQGDAFRRDNHIGAFRITNADGTRYVYGIAAYNRKYQEHKFSVGRAKCANLPGWCITLRDLDPGGENGAPYKYKTPSVDSPLPTGAGAGASLNYGSENFLEIKELSPYPSSYMLTAIIGPDYVDADDVPGPSDGDYGYWVKFSYERQDRLFKWRSPYLGAAFVRGPDNGRYVAGREFMRDKGYVSYGERETWYLSSIETATHKAFMCVNKSARTDALGAHSIAQNTLSPSDFRSVTVPWRLDSIRLFTKASLGVKRPDRCEDLAPGVVPIKGAHLDYFAATDSESLAKGAPNQASGTGKLTLKRVYFTHLGNRRGATTPYEFHYDDGLAATDPQHRDFNPDYVEGGRNRWDGYQPLPDVNGPALLDDDLTATRPADADQFDVWSSAWTLRRIIEPSGRTIRVQFESDDYASVQDRPAMRMFRVVSADAGESTGMISPAAAPAGEATHFRVYFGLDTPIPCGNEQECNDADAEVKRSYVGDATQLFFRIRVALKMKLNPPPAMAEPAKWQSVAGYAGISGVGVRRNGPFSSVGWIELSPVRQEAPAAVQFNPLAHAAWQYLRLEQPELIRDGGLNGDPNSDPMMQALGVLTLVDVVPELLASSVSTYAKWKIEGWGQRIDESRSFIRLLDPGGRKRGGGARVKSIHVSDRWRDGTGLRGNDLTTGYEYSYRLEGGRSSGVASYEPMTGGAENPLHVSKPFTEEVLLASNYNLFAELPLAESYYPAPIVGYSRVVRRSLAAVEEATGRASHPTSAGPTIFEYYTARDFPVRQIETPIVKARNPQPHQILIPLLGSINLESLAASQGYSTISNDMHGKSKRVTTYEYVGDDPVDGDYAVRQHPVQETTYRYSCSEGISDCAGGVNGLGLDLKNDGIPTAPLGGGERWPGIALTMAEESDFVVDLRHNQTQSWSGGLSVNLDAFMVAYLPIPIVVPMPNFGYSLTEAKTVVTNRSIHRAGILKSVSVRSRSSQTTTTNLLFDPISGSPVLTSSDNEFGDPVYRLERPASWIYPRMGAAFEHVGRATSLAGFKRTGRRLVPPAGAVHLCTERPASIDVPVAGCFPLGTEFAIPGPNGGARLTLVDDGGSPAFEIGGDEDPTLDLGPASTAVAIVVRSGNRNLLAATATSIKALSNPLMGVVRDCRRGVDGRPGVMVPDQGWEEAIPSVLEATHTTYCDNWLGGAFCGVVEGAAPGSALSSRGEFDRGRRGIFRPLAEYTFVAERAQSAPEVDLRRDGTFELISFGDGNLPRACSQNVDRWLAKRVQRRYAISGLSLEEEDALKVRSSALYTNRRTTPTAVATNASYAEIGYEGFESYDRSAGVVRSADTGEGNVVFSSEEGCTIQPGRGCIKTASRVRISSTVAHSGRSSLEVPWDVAFVQPRLELVPGRKYLVSGWMSLGPTGSAVADQASYRSKARQGTRGLQIAFMGPGGAEFAPSGPFEPSGPVIEGWQRIEGTFTAAKSPDVALVFLAGNKPGAAGLPVYFDDIRIQPEDARLESYVHDAKTLRLMARLDENNYATFYSYSPEGRVEAVRRETVRGILVEAERRLHLGERQP